VNDPYARRLSRVTDEVAAEGLDALVVGPSPDLVYLIGYAPPPLERATLLVLRPGSEPTLIVPELERPRATSSPAGDLVAVTGWVDGADPYATLAGLVSARGRIAVSDRLWAVHLLRLQTALPGTSFTPGDPVIGRIRAVKDENELAALREAGAAADASFRELCAGRFLGRTEADVATDLAGLLVANGHGRADFTIVASGPNSASPHHDPGDRTISAADVIVLDFGGELRGYFSDTTRTVVVREPPAGFEDVYRVVHDAQEAAFGVVAPGVAAQEVDRAARRMIQAAGYETFFIHRIGHGIGLELHEPPYLVEGNDVPLIPGMTFSIEPGVYLEGRFGVRIEDIVAVTPDGAERFNRSTRDLQVVE
jgi:Xaa-Pro aminopeptidase